MKSIKMNKNAIHIIAILIIFVMSIIVTSNNGRAADKQVKSSDKLIDMEVDEERIVKEINTSGLGGRFSLADIRADQNGEPCKVKLNNDSYNPKLIEKIGTCSENLDFNGFLWCSGETNSTVAFSTKGIGCLSVNNVLENRKNIVTRISIWQSQDGSYKLSTIYPKDRIAARVGSGYIKAFVPNGAGSYFRFIGSVKNFFPGYTFIGEANNPICFYLHKEYGLTYIRGAGKVIDANDNILFSN